MNKRNSNVRLPGGVSSNQINRTGDILSPRKQKRRIALEGSAPSIMGVFWMLFLLFLLGQAIKMTAGGGG